MAARALFNSFLKTGRDIVFKWWLSVLKTTGPRETKISDRHLSKREDENTDFFYGSLLLTVFSQNSAW